MKPFDLNMEEVLENWEVFHAIREIIANALDEQLMTDTQKIEIYQTDIGWGVRDFGRGIQIEHFTQNENPEKYEGPEGIIGKFGVGLKDALATFHRNGINPVIKSRFGTYTLETQSKEGFDDINTLHVMYDDSELEIQGTDFFLEGVTSDQIIQAKDLFLKFKDATEIEHTKYGSIIEAPEGGPNRVYINGVLASEEDNFLFSYNITNLTPKMRKALNRERTNVGRTTYSERVKSILKSAKSDTVKEELAEQISIRYSGEQCDEITWSEIAQVGIEALAKRDNNAVFVTEREMLHNPDEMERMRLEGRNIIVSNERDRGKIQTEDAVTFTSYVQDFKDSFEFDYVEPDSLSATERKVFDKTDSIMKMVGWTDEDMPDILISNTLQKETDTSSGILLTFSAIGLYEPAYHRITILRSQLASLQSYAGTLLHEAAHAASGATDATRAFESQLTEYLGVLCAELSV